MTQWFCTKCHCVFDAGAEYAQCCGAVEPFDAVTHAPALIGAANAWNDVWERWRNHPRLQQAAEDIVTGGNYSAATILNAFIEQLLDETDDD